MEQCANCVRNYCRGGLACGGEIQWVSHVASDLGCPAAMLFVYVRINNTVLDDGQKMWASLESACMVPFDFLSVLLLLETVASCNDHNFIVNLLVCLYNFVHLFIINMNKAYHQTHDSYCLDLYPSSDSGSAIPLALSNVKPKHWCFAPWRRHVLQCSRQRFIHTCGNNAR